MNIYLIRHTTPAIEPGVCYGQSDLEVAESFTQELAAVRAKLPDTAGASIYCSPLSRCLRLAESLGRQPPLIDPRLVELHFGDWEGLRWESIDQETLRHWGENYLTIAPPNGETMQQLHDRCVSFYTDLLATQHTDAVIVTHSGVIRTLLSHVLGLPLPLAFNFQIDFGGLTHIRVEPDVCKIICMNR